MRGESRSSKMSTRAPSMAGNYPSSDEGSEIDELQRVVQRVPPARRSSVDRAPGHRPAEAEVSTVHRRTRSHQASGEQSTTGFQKRGVETGGVELKSSQADFYAPAKNPPGRRLQEAQGSTDSKPALLVQSSLSSKAGSIAIEAPAVRLKPVQVSREFWSNKEQDRRAAEVLNAARPAFTHHAEQKQVGGTGLISNALSALGVRQSASTKMDRDKVAMLQSSNGALREENDRLKQKVQRRDNDLREASKQMESLVDSHMEDSHRVLAQLEKETRLAKTLSMELHSSELKLDKEKKQTQAGQATIRTLQEPHLQSVESIRFAPMSTSDIQQSLNNLQTGARQWAKKWGELSFDTFVQSPAFSQLSKGLHARGCLPKVEKLYHLLLSKESIQKPGRASVLLLSAAVFIDLLVLIIANPYFAFVGEDNINVKDSTALARITSFVQHSDEAGAEALRCQVLRLLDPPENDANPAVAVTKGFMKHQRERASHVFAQKIMTELSESFPDQDLAKALQELEELAVEASELSSRLWTRKARIGLERPSISYSSKAEDIAAHPLHMGDLDDDPQALEGLDYVVLCSPAVWMHGTTEGKDFQSKRLIKKAVAWMG